MARRLPGLLTWLHNTSSHPKMQRLRQNRDEVRSVAWKLLDSKRKELKDGAPRRDVMSLLGLLPPSLVSSRVVVECLPPSQS